MPLQTLILARDFPAENTSVLAGRKTATRSGNDTLPFRRKEATMRSDGPKRLEKTWEELATAASTETDPEKLATILEEIFAALEERERTLSLPQNRSGF